MDGIVREVLVATARIKAFKRVSYGTAVKLRRKIHCGLWNVWLHNVGSLLLHESQ